MPIGHGGTTSPRGGRAGKGAKRPRTGGAASSPPATPAPGAEGGKQALLFLLLGSFPPLEALKSFLKLKTRARVTVSESLVDIGFKSH